MKFSTKQCIFVPSHIVYSNSICAYVNYQNFTSGIKNVKRKQSQFFVCYSSWYIAGVTSNFVKVSR
jgi:hypothetical protein